MLALGTLDIVARTLDQFAAGVVASLPKLVAGVVFLAAAAVLVWLVRRALGVVLRRALPDEPVYARFVGTVVAVFLWFGVALSFLSVVGLDGIAASLGTASGFVALGVAYALSGMIADAVAGVYLLRDPDFQPGDTVTTGDVTGVVEQIELRKTRIAVETDGDDRERRPATLVRANAAIEKEWRKLHE
jgi:small-conductance mechanosensitive channel